MFLSISAQHPWQESESLLSFIAAIRWGQIHGVHLWAAVPDASLTKPWGAKPEENGGR